MKTTAAFANLKRAWAARFACFLVCIVSLTMMNGPARAGSEQKLIYDVYASGFHVLQADLHMGFPEDGRRYELGLYAKTFGFLGKLVPWEGSFESGGWVEKKGDPLFRPELHRSVAAWRGESDIKEYTYNRDGTFESLLVDDSDKKPKTEKPDPALTVGTIDVMTAALNILNKVSGGKKCEGAYDVFDGKRRFTQFFTHKRDVMLEASKYNVYSGPAQECVVEIEPVAGDWHEKMRGWLNIQEQGRQQGSLPTVWIGQLYEGGPAIPVKILVKTKYGALFMHLAEYHNGGEIVIAQKRSEKK